MGGGEKKRAGWRDKTTEERRKYRRRSERKGREEGKGVREKSSGRKEIINDYLA